MPGFGGAEHVQPAAPLRMGPLQGVPDEGGVGLRLLVLAQHAPEPSGRVGTADRHGHPCGAALDESSRAPHGKWWLHLGQPRTDLRRIARRRTHGLLMDLGENGT